MLQRYLILWLVLSSLVAAFWPVAVFDPFLASKPALGVLVAVTMLCVGSLLPADEVRDVLRRWPLILFGTAVQYGSMPLLAWGMTELFGLTGAVRVGVILAGCVPGAMASNVLTHLAKGNVSYSVGLTTSATLLSPLIVPLALKLTLGEQANPSILWGAATGLVWQVVIPVIVGGLLSHRNPSWKKLADRAAANLANLVILWIIAFAVAANRDKLLQAGGSLVPVLLGLNLLGYLAGDVAGRLLRLSTGMRRALTLEVGMQNAGVGVSLAGGLFPDQPEVTLPCGLYAFGCMLTGTVLAQIMHQRMTADPTDGASVQ
ncbi:MAG: bile acid:sodium symporter family protein [Planctomycetaceae bacterium]|nr:bile acid:sodium symporter family protein [Planctomycetaceae bacterium]